MVLQAPEALCAPLAARLPRQPAGLLPALAGAGLLVPPFGFGLADPSRAPAAMFLTTALAVLAVVRLREVSVVYWLAGAAFVFSCIFPNWFSLLAYLIGVICFIAVGQGAVTR